MPELKDVAVGVLFDRERRLFLLTQRAFDDRFAAGTWCFPGGKVEPGEDPEVACDRELEEEIGVVTTGTKIGCFTTENNGYRLHWFVHEKWDGSPVTSKEVAGLGWFDLWDIRKLILMPSTAEGLVRLAELCS